MNSTITIRLAESQREKVHEIASRLGKSDSEWIRETIERELTTESLGNRIGHLKGRLVTGSTPEDSLSQSIRDRNWRS